MLAKCLNKHLWPSITIKGDKARYGSERGRIISSVYIFSPTIIV